MASTTPHLITVDDDDEFDWEAAFREIDVACQTTKPSISCSDNNKPKLSKQSTLDRFISPAGAVPPLENGDTLDRDKSNLVGDEGLCCIDVDAEAAKTWIYPVNVPMRKYQLSITKTALFSNTLVALPTGLGKTLIAAVVMYNYFRWFPEGKIVFAAPSRPLVMQQIEACHNIVGIPQVKQVLQGELASGKLNEFSLLHLKCWRRIFNLLMAAPVQLRILALTATPGSKQQSIQNIIDNLHISTLEYRNESDHDVSPYVHNRNVELIEVAMGQDAIEINNVLLEVIRPFVIRLCAVGVLQNRDLQTLSPCDLLNSRDKFRQAPPLALPHMKYGEVEGYFGALITLYHIRKLLSSHGIRPAHEMLEEKMQQGPFARLMSKNEVLWKAKCLMQQSLSNGTPNPKLSKMLDILIDHFKANNPQNSRVIIFSNFRGSVRDIMDALAKIGESVKATQFIGQSSGKASKGQSQKVQQAVLEKFRAGGFNVIIATSIGEEGLDIMEVDLVICFDANISPLRMIQRMGRTGRKHDGRVVVLACEGSEMKGYMRKQANSKTVRKHMRNGGMNSFNFHSSPRMIPHIFKPEVQFVELSIEQFVPRGRKGKDDHPIQAPISTDKLTNVETEVLAKYFGTTGKITWRPSLIAFPPFQAFPTGVHKIPHSFRTEILIDMMQHLQGLSFSGNSKTFFVEGEVSTNEHLGVETVEQYDKSRVGNITFNNSNGLCNKPCVFRKDEASMDEHLAVETVEQHEESRKDSIIFGDSPKAQPIRELSYSEESPIRNTKTKEKHSMSSSQGNNPHVHSYLFGSDFVSVDTLGNVLILSVPLIPSKEVSHSKCASASSSMLLNCLKQDSCHSGTSQGQHKGQSMEEKAVANLRTSGQARCTMDETLLISKLHNSLGQQEKKLDGVEEIVQTPILKGSLSHEGDTAVETLVANKTPIFLAAESSDDIGDTDLSPRLTNLIKSGVVPESPINESGPSNGRPRNEFLVPDLVSPAKVLSEMLLTGKNEKVTLDVSTSGQDTLNSPISNGMHSPILKPDISAKARGSNPSSPIVEEVKTPLANLTNNSCSKDWHLSSGDKSASVKQERKFKRLRKYGDTGQRRNMKSMKENSIDPSGNLAETSSIIPIRNKHNRGKQKPVDNVRAFIEEEAEVSSEAEVSDDEEDDQNNNSYDDSFIDDRIDPTATSTQAEDSRSDMMAIYRRSLLSQSPVVRQPNFSADFSPCTLAPMTRITETGSSLSKTTYSLNQSSERNTVSIQINPEIISSEAIPWTSVSPRENERELESRKRKLGIYQGGSVPVINLERQFQLEAASKESSLQHQAEKIETIGDVFYDDQFYEGLDLDAVEAQATMLLRHKSELFTQKQDPQSLDLFGSPTFDLGI
ncbi:DEAD-box ATP-dependent RNA helicase FANCM isoform X2 [Vitis riparia]|uniref:DEAD-box ATP-dependent RNA helicase FANCM isoform X2 n=1 Tax=Vitis riparia TaxID=96939 RepID=UPI00155AF95D|nr:DEAD-box ATP-dependent RNA helicase FANCM isoform X2 [Vitis riparia]